MNEIDIYIYGMGKHYSHHYFMIIFLITHQHNTINSDGGYIYTETVRVRQNATQPTNEFLYVSENFEITQILTNIIKVGGKGGVCGKLGLR